MNLLASSDINNITINGLECPSIIDIPRLGRQRLRMPVS